MGYVIKRLQRRTQTVVKRPSRPRRVLAGQMLECRRCLATVAAVVAADSTVDRELADLLVSDLPVSDVSYSDMKTAATAAGESTPLTERVDTVRLGGEGIGSLRVSPTGELGQLFYLDDVLHYRVRSPGGSFQTQHVVEVEDYLFFSSAGGVPAQLLYQSDGSPIVLVAEETGFQVYRPDLNGVWSVVDAVSYEPDYAFEVTGSLFAEIGPDDSIHALVAAGDWYDGRLLYATDRSGSWDVSQIARPAAAGAYFHFSGLASRYLSLAVASDHSVHIAYTPEFMDFGEGGFRRPFDRLAYLSNRSGTWQTEIVHQPSDDSGQSGLASSIAIAPSGQPAIAQFFVDRYPTGSAVSSQLLLHQRTVNATWTTELVTDRPDGYVAGDGAKFTGFAPHLVFDAFGRPHIAFSDHASQHFGNFGADEFAGQIRHAVKGSEGWRIKTVFAQSDPIRQTLRYPTMAILPNEIVFVGIQRIDQLDRDFFVVDTATNYIEAIVPQTGLTIQPSSRRTRSGESVQVVLGRHHADRSVDAMVQVKSGRPDLIATRTYTIPAGSDQILVEMPVTRAESLTATQVVTLNVDADGYYPGGTIVLVDPVSDWAHNVDLIHDVNGDGRITPLDALLLINWLAAADSGIVSAPSVDLRFPDINADNRVTPLDALRVINFLARPDQVAGENIPLATEVSEAVRFTRFLLSK